MPHRFVIDCPVTYSTLLPGRLFRLSSGEWAKVESSDETDEGFIRAVVVLTAPPAEMALAA